MSPSNRPSNIEDHGWKNRRWGTRSLRPVIRCVLLLSRDGVDAKPSPPQSSVACVVRSRESNYAPSSSRRRRRLRSSAFDSGKAWHRALRRGRRCRTRRLGSYSMTSSPPPRNAMVRSRRPWIVRRARANSLVAGSSLSIEWEM